MLSISDAAYCTLPKSASVFLLFLFWYFYHNRYPPPTVTIHASTINKIAHQASLLLLFEIFSNDMVVVAGAYPNYSLYAIIVISYDSTDD